MHSCEIMGELMNLLADDIKFYNRLFAQRKA